MYALWSPYSYFHLQWAADAAVLPPVTCLWYLAWLWWAGELFGVQQAVFVAWFVVAFGIQLGSRGPYMWIAGMLGQVSLAIVLILKKHIDDIY
jgi:hypothetical protein